MYSETNRRKLHPGSKHKCMRGACDHDAARGARDENERAPGSSSAILPSSADWMTPKIYIGFSIDPHISRKVWINYEFYFCRVLFHKFSTKPILDAYVDIYK